MSDAFILTYSGCQISLENPSPADVRLTDIMVALGRMPRFCGHTQGHLIYSVLQHSLEVAYNVPENLRLPALLHDAHEAYIGDVTRPLKSLLPQIKGIQSRLDIAIAAAFGFDAELFHHPEIKLADERMLATEARDLMAPSKTIWSKLKEPYTDKIDICSSEWAHASYLRVFRAAFWDMHGREYIEQPTAA